MTAAARNPWLPWRRPHPEARLRLFCFPYAGGASVIFRPWSEVLPAEVEVCGVELPGRGTRIRERPIEDLATLADALVETVVREGTSPTAFFGHSMGALLAFEVARRLRREGGQLARLFVSAAPAPQLRSSHARLHVLPREAFVAEITRLGGTPPEVLHNAPLLALLLPALRADLACSETYGYVDQPPLTCGISAYSGRHDALVSVQQIDAWRAQTAADFTLQSLAGDHFFLHSARPQLLQLLAAELLGLVEHGL